MISFRIWLQVKLFPSIIVLTEGHMTQCVNILLVIAGINLQKQFKLNTVKLHWKANYLM